MASPSSHSSSSEEPAQYPCACEYGDRQEIPPECPSTILDLASGTRDLTEAEAREYRKHAMQHLAFLSIARPQVENLELNLRERNADIIEVESNLSAMSGFYPRILPDEILSRIFVFCAKTFSPETRDVAHYLKTTDSLIKRGQHPWDLSFVNRKWRKVALESPFLWTDICLCLQNYRNDTGSRLSQMMTLELLLERSKNLPLMVTVISTSNIPADETGPLPFLLGAVADRISHLRLAVPIAVSGVYFSERRLRTFPNLEHVEVLKTYLIGLERNTWEPEGEDKVIMPLSCPRTNFFYNCCPKLAKWTIHKGALMSNMNPNWDESTFTIEAATADESRAFFLRHSDIVVCRIHALGRKDYRMPNGIIPMPRMRECVITDTGGIPNGVARYMAYYLFPVLTHMEWLINDDIDDTDSVMPAFDPVVKTPNLRSLVINSISLDGLTFAKGGVDNLVALLAKIPLLEDLSLGLRTKAALVSFLQCMKAESALMSKLESLEIVAIEDEWTAATRKLLFAMLDVQTSIKDVFLPSDPLANVKDAASKKIIKRLQARGVTFHLGQNVEEEET